MNIQTVAKNLRNTIAGKEFFLTKMQNGTASLDPVDRAVSSATQTFLKINIDELKRILADVEQSAPDEFSNTHNEMVSQ